MSNFEANHGWAQLTFSMGIVFVLQPVIAAVVIELRLLIEYTSLQPLSGLYRTCQFKDFSIQVLESLGVLDL